MFKKLKLDRSVDSDMLISPTCTDIYTYHDPIDGEFQTDIRETIFQHDKRYLHQNSQSVTKSKSASIPIKH